MENFKAVESLGKLKLKRSKKKKNEMKLRRETHNLFLKIFK